MPHAPFHLAIQVRDIEEARQFYGRDLGFAEGRSSDEWIDFDFYGHQLVVHLNREIGVAGCVNGSSNPVDGKGVPVPHFGVVLEMDAWQALAAQLSGVIDKFIVKPYVRFEGQTGEQATMFFADPSGNALEFKAFKDIEGQLFAK
ncbi:MAG: extradiol dioxygenase family protein [Planctomycetota bacterium]|jgi:extradiol dioxygenase family protein